MTLEQEQWLDQATAFQRAKRYDEARDYALRVVRADCRNTKALWIVASATNSLTERRNVLNMLLRAQPDNVHARQMLNAVEEQLKSTSTTSTTSTTTSTSNTTAIRSIKPAASQQHVLLYAAIVAVLVIAAAVVIAVTI